MKYAKAKEAEYVEEKAYKLYVTDSFFYLGQNKHLSEKYSTLLERLKAPQVKKTGDEIASEIIKSHGLKFKGGNR